MNIKLERYDILSAADSLKIPSVGDQIELKVKKRDEESESDSTEMLIDVDYVLPKGMYIYIQGNAHLNADEKRCSANFVHGKSECFGEIVGELVIKDLQEGD